MSKEELCFKLIELYYNNKSIFDSYCMGLKDLFENYNKMFKILKIESDE